MKNNELEIMQIMSSLMKKKASQEPMEDKISDSHFPKDEDSPDFELPDSESDSITSDEEPEMEPLEDEDSEFEGKDLLDISDNDELGEDDGPTGDIDGTPKNEHDVSEDDWEDPETYLLSEFPSESKSSELSTGMDSMNDYASDGCSPQENEAYDAEASKKEASQIANLKRLEKSYRRKGDQWSADLVFVTAREMKKDIVKRAASKSQNIVKSAKTNDVAVKSLIETMTDLRKKGLHKEADKIRLQIEKISRS